MKIVPATEEGVTEALAVLARGGVVVHATETCYGLACDLSNAGAVDRLFAMKKREPDQPVSSLFPDIAATKEFVEWSAEAETLAKDRLPGPLTLILPLKTNLPYVLFPVPKSAEHNSTRPKTLGIRVSSHSLAISLARRFGRPLSTTSANVHGSPNTYGVQEIQNQFATPARRSLASPAGRIGEGGSNDNAPDLVLDSGSIPVTPPSAIIDCTKGGAILRVR